MIERIFRMLLESRGCRRAEMGSKQKCGARPSCLRQNARGDPRELGRFTCYRTATSLHRDRQQVNIQLHAIQPLNCT